MTITASMVKDLRERTGIGMMECKKALEETQGNLDEAIKILRERGAIKAAKREGRTASEGLVAVSTNADNTRGVIALITSETDFVARNEEFIATVKGVAVGALAAGATTAETALAAKLPDGRQIGTVIEDLRAKIGEKIELSTFESLEADAVADYSHFNGKIAVLVGAKAAGLAADKKAKVVETLKNIAMHAAANNPRFLDTSEVDEKTLNDEKEIALVQARNEGKPEAILPKIVEGKMRAYYKQNCLVEQPFAMDPDKTVAQVVKDLAKAVGVDVTLAGFKRAEVGSTAKVG